MSYIKREPLLAIAKELQGKLFGAPLIVRAIESAPDEDVVDVVRCKDCRLYDDPYCEIVRYVRMPTDYCSFGERRENNGT